MFQIPYIILLISTITLHSCYSQVFVKPVNFDPSIMTPRVVGGTPAKLGDFPYQLALKTMSARSSRMYRTFCGAVIIGPSKILTAAHCYVSTKSNCKLCSLPGHVKKEETFAVAGCLNNRARYSGVDSIDRGQWRRVRGVRFPKGYKFPKKDIAVAIPATPFIFNANVASIAYARSFVDHRGTCVVSGFGRTGKHAAAKPSAVLLTAALEIIPWSVCNRMFRKNMKNFICTSYRITDIGMGDSGGPLVCPSQGGGKSLLVGIVSGHRTRVGSFFTRVSTYKRFIERNSGNNNNVNLTINTICLLLIYNTIPLF